MKWLSVFILSGRCPYADSERHIMRYVMATPFNVVFIQIVRGSAQQQKRYY